MNNCLPDWNYECDLPINSQKKPMGPEHELAELLWRNGQVVLHSQTQRKPVQVQKHDQPTLRQSGPYGNSSSSLIQDDEAVSWIQYSLEDPFEKEFCSNFFSELPPPSDPMEADKPTKQFEEDKFKRSVVNEFPGNSMLPPPRFQFPDSAHQNNDLAGLGKVVNFPQFLPPVKIGGGGGNIGSTSEQYGGKGSGNLMQGEVRECSVMTVGSSYCGSNQVPNDLDLSSNGAGTSGLSAGPVKEDGSNIMPQSDRGKTETLEPTLSSSSGGSGSSFGRTRRKSTGVNSHKRKGRDAEESECQSEAAELESAAVNKAAQRSRSSRRSRAAEVHNLSERRRRDRINEKMKALQELIPHCNKTDKASMLDEAIEYLKSLQLQLQVMWMGSGMASMMFPGVQHYISRMGIGIGPPPMSSIHNPMHLQRVPLVDQSLSMAPSPNQAVMCQTPILNPVNIQNQMHNLAFSEQYARYMGFHHMQTPSQPLNVFRFGPHAIPQNQTTAPPGTSSGHLNGGSAASNASSGKMG